MVVMAGGLAPSHVEVEHLPELMRLIRAGGLFINVMRHEYLPEMGVIEACQILEKQNKWKCLECSVSQEKYFMQYDAYVMVYQIIK